MASDDTATARRGPSQGQSDRAGEGARWAWHSAAAGRGALLPRGRPSQVGPRCVSVEGDNLGLLDRGGGPFLHERPCYYCPAVGFGQVVQRHLVAAEAGDHRRVEGVGDGRLTEQEVATLAEALAAVAPDRLDAVDVGLNLRGERVLRCAQVEVHRQGVAQRLEDRKSTSLN